MKIVTYNAISKQFRREWVSLWSHSSHAHFFNHPDWTESACLLPVIFAAYKKGKLFAVLPLEKTQKFLVPAYSCPGGNCLDHSTLLLKSPDKKVVSQLIEAVREQGHLYLPEICEGYSRLFSSKNPDRLLCARPASASPYLELQPDPFANLSHKHAKQIKSVLSKYSSNLRFSFVQVGELSHLQEVIALEQRSNKFSKNTQQLACPNVIRLLKNLLKKSQLSFALLYFGDRLIAADIGYVYSQVFHNFYTVFDKEYSHCIPGRILKYLTIQHLCQRQFSLYDFSRGVSRYKQDFAKQSVQHYDLYVSANPLIRAHWRACNSFVSWLEKHHDLYSQAFTLKHLLSL